jgi:hypothetical protein
MQLIKPALHVRKRGPVYLSPKCDGDCEGRDVGESEVFSCDKVGLSQKGFGADQCIEGSLVETLSAVISSVDLSIPLSFNLATVLPRRDA